jgi:DNA-binding PadR family transcriptional regulator
MPAKPFRPTFSIPRGFMEVHILRILETPRHGYEIMKLIEQECSYWKPSPGSVYPILRKLQNAGLITERDMGKRKVYRITKKGVGRIKKFDSYKEEIKEKMAALFRMMGEDLSYVERSFDFFEKIKRDPAKMAKATKLRKRFMEDLKMLAEE